MSKELSEKRQANGQLVFNAANIAIHCVTVDFLQDMTTRSFPFHLAHKKIPHVSQDGEITIKPKMNNGYKLEKFIFDSLEYSKNPCAFFVDRFGNFSPVKNASAEGVKDSPATACEDLARYHIFLVRKFGGVVNYGGNSFSFFL